MESRSLNKILLLVLIICMAQGTLAFCQLTPEEVYKAHVLKFEEDGNSEKRHARYFHLMGMGELNRLRTEKRKKGGLDHEKQVRLERLETVLLPITEVVNTLRSTSAENS